MILRGLLRLLTLLLRLHLALLRLHRRRILSGLPRVLLIQNVLIASHALSLGNAELFAFLVPAPFVNLGLSQFGLNRDFSKHLFCPMRISIKGVGELLELVSRLALSLANDTLQLATLLVEDMASLFGDLQRRGRL